MFGANLTEKDKILLETFAEQLATDPGLECQRRSKIRPRGGAKSGHLAA
jgi:hypothetical protein